MVFPFRVCEGEFRSLAKLETTSKLDRTGLFLFL